MSQKSVISGLESHNLSKIQTGYPLRQPLLPPIVASPQFATPYSNGHYNPTNRNSAVSESVNKNGHEAPSVETDQKPGRSRLQNILNPAGTADDRCSQRQSQSPQTSVSSVSWRPSERSTQSPSNVSSTSTNFLGSRSNGSQSGRQLMIPTTKVNLPSGTIDAKASPFLSSRPQNFPIEAGNAYPPVGHSYGYPTQQTLTPPDRRPDVISQAPPSQSDSPTTSYSSYSQLSRTSPVPQLYNSGSTHPSSQYGPNGTTRISGPESAYDSVASGMGQSAIQLMTLDTDQGPIQVPVDVQAASKMADEKRKRNAGASARFRQRRKEKERESSQTIAKLENQVREIGEEREYYRAERDYFRQLVYSTSATQAQMVPRMPSPRTRRLVTQTGGNASNPPNPQWQQSPPEERGGQSGRNTRRRISSYTPQFDLPPPSSVSPPKQQQSGYTPPPQPLFAPTATHPVARPALTSTLPPLTGSFESAKYDQWSNGR
ncbi:MAG: hypothetical protein MMC33_001514 [Icmadophila ericetorum]|nr:hypothetical protein [Icmadophila ericetorum]